MERLRAASKDMTVVVAVQRVPAIDIFRMVIGPPRQIRLTGRSGGGADNDDPIGLSGIVNLIRYCDHRAVRTFFYIQQRCTLLICM